MKYYGQAQETATRILEAFQREEIPAALAQVFIHRKDDVPCRKWSWANQLIAALFCKSDARGYRQWREVDRFVKHGEKAAFILVPLIKIETDENGTETSHLIGFKSAPVFGIQQTDGKPLERDTQVDAFLESLPFIEVARHWNLSVDCFNGREDGHFGFYQYGKGIGLGVSNLATWSHELIHAADDKLGNLKERGQHFRSECVAEFGGAVLLQMLGLERDADKGGCFQYIKSYCEKENQDHLAVCLSVLKRVCDAVAFILAESETLKAEKPAEEKEIAA